MKRDYGVLMKVQIYSVELIAYLCFKRRCLPPELSRIILSYLCKRIDNHSIRDAVALMKSDKPLALILYGDIRYWETSRVRNM